MIRALLRKCSVPSATTVTLILLAAIATAATLTVTSTEVMIPGIQGPPGIGVGIPAGGTHGQLLMKRGMANYTSAWINPPAGTGDMMSESWAPIIAGKLDAATFNTYAATHEGGGGGAVPSVFGRTGPILPQAGDYTAGMVGADPVGAATSAVSGHETNYPHANLPSNLQKAALAGSSGTPGGGNPYVTDQDPRLTNARTPLPHSGTHASGGGDPLTLTTAQVTGLDSALAGKQAALSNAATLGKISESAGAPLWNGGAWPGGGGGGDMYKATYDPQGKNGDAFARANHTGTQPAASISGLAPSATTDTTTTANITDSTNKRFLTDAQRSVLINTSNTNSGDVTIGTPNGLSLAGQALSLAAATNSVTGALTAADHATYSNAAAQAATALQPSSPLDASKLTGTAGVNTTGTAAGLSAQYVDWTAGSGGASIKNKPTFGTAATKDVATSGNASSTQVVKGDDGRLIDPRTPLVHKSTHATGGTDPLTPADIGAAPASHTQAWSTITSPPTTLSGYGITDAATAAQGAKADTALQPGTTAAQVGAAAIDDVRLAGAGGPNYFYASPSWWKFQANRAAKKNYGVTPTPAPTSIFVIGDSISGYGPASAYIPAFSHYAGFNALGYANFYSSTLYGSYAPMTVSGCTPVRGDTSSPQAWGPGGSRVDCTAGNSITYAPTTPYRFDSFKIWYERTPAGGTFTYTVDGGTPVAVDTAGAESLQAASVTISGASQATTHSIVINITVGSVRLYGMETSQRAQPGIKLDYFQAGGTSLSQWAVNPGFVTQAVAASNPDMVLIWLGANDAMAGVTAAQFGTNLRSFITSLALPAKTALVVATNTPKGTTTGQATNDAAADALFEGYRDQIVALAKELDFSVMDLRKYWPGYTDGFNAGMFSDNVHPSEKGYKHTATGMASAFFQATDLGSTNELSLRNRGLLFASATEGIGAVQFTSDGSYVNPNTGFYFPSLVTGEFKMSGTRLVRWGTNENGLNTTSFYPTSTNPNVLFAFRQGSSQNQAFLLKVNSDNTTNFDTNNGDFWFAKSSAEKFRITSTGTTTTGTHTATDFSGPLNGTVGATTPAAGTFTNVSVTTGDIKLVNTANGTSSVPRTSRGVLITATGMNDISAKYTPPLKFGSNDPDFAGETRFLAGIAGYAGETYNSTSAGAMGLEFFTTPIGGGASDPISRMKITPDGNVAVTGQVQSTVATGTAPFSVASTTEVPNLKSADAGKLNGQTANYYATSNSPAITGHPTIEGVTSTGATGTGKLVFDTSPTLATPNIGVATATTVNKLTITPPTTTAVLTIAEGKSLTVSNALTVAGTDGTIMTFPSVSSTIPAAIASGTATLGTTAIASGTCATAVTATAAGVATTDVIDWGFNSDPTSTTGYSASTSGMLTIIAYPTAGSANFKVCNNTGGSITPGAVTLNWKVRR